MEIKMHKKNQHFLTASEIVSEMEATSDTVITANYFEFERFVSDKKFSCMEFAFDRLFEAELIKGYIAETCFCLECSGRNNHQA